MKSPVPRVAAIHDLSCFGRAALTVVMPILSSMGIQVCPLPTAIFSTHGRFPGYYSQDLTEQLRHIIHHWKELRIEFDAIYSGFLNSFEQIEFFSDFILDFSRKGQVVIIDPVLGDHGKVYGVTPENMIEGMRRYIRLADVITPNLTEAALLLNEPYKVSLQEDEIKAWLIRLADLGPNIVILTSVPVGESSHDHIRVMAYQRDEHQFWEMTSKRIAANFPGTGDAFSSVVLGSLLQGDSLSKALHRSVQFLSTGIAHAFTHGVPEREGIILEHILSSLNETI